MAMEKKALVETSEYHSMASTYTLPKTKGGVPLNPYPTQLCMKNIKY